MELVSNWWCSDAAADVHTCLVQREIKGKRNYQARSPQLAYRRQLVDWITSIAERHKLGLTSLHLSVYLLDHFMDNFDVSRSQLNLLAMGCLSVATKFEEKEEDIPKQIILSEYCGGAYAPADFLQMELMLLKFFDWEVGLVTPAHFINFYVNLGCPERDQDAVILNGDGSVVAWRRQFDALRNYARYFMSVCLQFHNFHDYTPSTVAAATVSASRACLDMVPAFPQSLQAIKNFSETDLIACHRELLRIHDRDKNRRVETSLVRRSMPDTSTPEGTPEGTHGATNPQHRRKCSDDDSMYHSDEISDGEGDSHCNRGSLKGEGCDNDEGIAAEEMCGRAPRLRSPSCSPILPGDQDIFCQGEADPATGTDVGSSNVAVTADITHEFRSQDNFGVSDDVIAETVEIEMETDEEDNEARETVHSHSCATTARSQLAFLRDGAGSFEVVEPLGMALAREERRSDLVVDASPDDGVQEVDLVGDNDVVLIDEDDVREVKTILAKSTDDSGVVAEDFAAEEECYEEGPSPALRSSHDDGRRARLLTGDFTPVSPTEFYLAELQPAVNPAISVAMRDRRPDSALATCSDVEDESRTAHYFRRNRPESATGSDSDAVRTHNGCYRVSVPFKL